MIKVNFNQKQTENMKPETKGLAATGTTQIYTKFTEVIKESQEILDAKSVTKIIINFILICSFPLGLKIYEVREINKLIAQKNQEQSILEQKNQQLSQLKKSLESYAYLTDLANEFQNKRDFLKQISQDRLTVPRVMDLIQNQTPKDVWLSNIKISLQGENRELSLSGFSFKEASINYFTNNLQAVAHKGSISVDTRDVKDGQSASILKTSFHLRGFLK